MIRLRETANHACDPNLIDDDNEWHKRAIEKIGCTPPYWNNNTEEEQEPEMICDSKRDLVLTKDYWRKSTNILAKEIFNEYARPCNTFAHLTNSIVRTGHNAPEILKIKIRLQDDYYEEILNTRAVSMSDLWANVGGYVGIFCGYSLLQATSYFITNVKRCIVSNQK